MTTIQKNNALRKSKKDADRKAKDIADHTGHCPFCKTWFVWKHKCNVMANGKVN